MLYLVSMVNVSQRMHRYNSKPENAVLLGK